MMTMSRVRAPRSRAQARACFADAYPFPVGPVLVMLLTGEVALVRACWH